MFEVPRRSPDEPQGHTSADPTSRAAGQASGALSTTSQQVPVEDSTGKGHRAARYRHAA